MDYLVGGACASHQQPAARSHSIDGGIDRCIGKPNRAINGATFVAPARYAGQGYVMRIIEAAMEDAAEARGATAAFSRSLTSSHVHLEVRRHTR